MAAPSSLLAQASVLDLYDQDRARMQHTKGGDPIDGAAAVKALLAGIGAEACLRRRRRTGIPGRPILVTDAR